MSIIAGFMLPHPPLLLEEIGHKREKDIAQVRGAYQNVAKEIKELRPETIVIATPHSVTYEDYFHISPGFHGYGDFGEFGYSQIQLQVEYDALFTESLAEYCDEKFFPAGTRGEKKKNLDHGVMVPLTLIREQYKNFKIVRVSLSNLSLEAHYTLGQYIREVSDELDRRTVFIASGDLSHRLTETGPYGFHPDGPEYDRMIMKIMSTGDFSDLFEIPYSLRECAGECGHRSFTILAGTLDGKDVKISNSAYAGPYGVGYGICEYIPAQENLERYFLKTRQQQDAASKRALENDNKTAPFDRQKDEYVMLAENSLTTYFLSRKILDPPGDLPPCFYKKGGGVFVSIQKNGELRGCIGTLQGTKENLAVEIINNAIQAAVADPRFFPVDSSELDELNISVDVLGEIEEVKDVKELDHLKYGIIVSSKKKRGVLLPSLDGVKSVEEQLRIAKRKAGISENESIKIKKFMVERHGKKV